MKLCSLTQRLFCFLNADLSSISSGMKTYTRRCINNIVIINPAWLTFCYPSLQSQKILGNEYESTEYKKKKKRVPNFFLKIYFKYIIIIY